MRRHRGGRAAALSLIAFGFMTTVIASCSGTGISVFDTPCPSGPTAPCTCADGGAGLETCAADGIYGVCLCDGTPPSAPGDIVGDGNIPDSSTADVTLAEDAEDGFTSDVTLGDSPVGFSDASGELDTSVDTSTQDAGHEASTADANACVSYCTSDSDCQNSCQAPNAGTTCCHIPTGICYISASASCPVPVADAGLD